MLYISSSTGIFSYNPDSGKVSQILSNKNRSGFFSKKSHGFFGICIDKNNHLIVASREKLGTPKAGKPTTDTGLHYIDPMTNTNSTIGYIKDIHDVHQIGIFNEVVFLSDTGKNRIIAYDITEKKIVCTINFGIIREDINHINAITIHENQIIVGLNNRGIKPSEILTLPLSLIENHTTVEDAFEHAIELKSLAPYTNTHDIEPFNDDFLICSSHDSLVFNSNTLKPVVKSDSWVRGISCSSQHIWVAQSIFAKRSKRHSRSINGSVLKINSKTLEIEDIITIPETGQINDLQYVKTAD